jgi:phosphoglycerate kinase
MKREFLVLDDLPLDDKTVILRVDINSPVNPESGKLLGTARLRAHIKTIERLNGSRVIILGHQSRPGKDDFVSLTEHASELSKLLGRRINFVDDLLGRRARDTIVEMEPGQVTLLENVRFLAEEVSLKNKPIEMQGNTHLVKNLAPLADYYVNDAFAAAHRSQPSLVGFTEKLPSAAGLLMEKELDALNKVLTSKERPCVAVLGGAKVNDSLEVAENMLKNKVADKILTTGVVANIVLTAKGYKLGKPSKKFLETEFKDLKELIDTSKRLIKKYNNKIETPIDLIGNNNGNRAVETLDSLPSQYPIFDVGLETVVKYSNIIKDAKIIIANGPAGVFEIEEFGFGTNEIFIAIANSKGYSVIGGGETSVVAEKLGVSEDIDHVSSGGGACINYLAGRTLPVLEALKNSKILFEKNLKKKKK